MRNTELIPVQLSMQVKPETKQKRLPDIHLWDIPVRMLGILFAGAIPISGLSPFGIAFLTLDRKFSFKSLLSLIFVSVGYLLCFDFWVSARYISAAVIFELILFVLERSEKPTLYFTAGAAAGSMFICETAVLIMQGFTTAGLILSVCDATLMFVGALVFDKSRGVLLENKFLSKTLTSDEKISLCVMAGIILLSTKSMTIFEVFNISNLLGCLLLALVALACRNVTPCAIGGIIAGIILGLGGEFPEYVAVFTLCGFILGGAARLGKNTVCLCLCIFGFAAMLYLGIPLGDEHIPNIYEIISAAVVSYLLPHKVIVSARRILDFEPQADDDAARFKQYVGDKLDCIADSFSDIAVTFSELSDKPGETDMSDISMLFDTAADRVCRDCERAEFCWKKDFNATYATMFRFLEIMENNGCLQCSDVPPLFVDKCIRLVPLISEVNRMFEIYKVNTAWKSKLGENRELTAEQFRSISDIIRNAADEICGERRLDIFAANEIKDSLSDIGISVDNVEVLCDKNGKYTVQMNVLDPDGDLESCQKRIKSVIKKVMGINVAAPYSVGMENRGRHKLYFCQIEGFEPILGIAGFSKDTECGDKHSASYLSDGKLAVTISDGMGTGHSAARESDAIVSLLESFLEAGFDKTIAVKLVNSVMVMKSANDAFATVDMCVIDLYTGQVEFIKNGAEASYIKHGGYTETVRCASLPIGIVSINDIETFGRTLLSGEAVVMTSDGVVSSPEETWIRELIDAADEKAAPQDIADAILNEAARRKSERGAECDDMTVICIKLSKRAAAAGTSPTAA